MADLNAEFEICIEVTDDLITGHGILIVNEIYSFFFSVGAEVAEITGALYL